MLPSIHTVRNKGFSGVALHAKRYGSSIKPKIQTQKYIPVNHFITTKPNPAMTMSGNGTQGYTEQAL